LGAVTFFEKKRRSHGRDAIRAGERSGQEQKKVPSSEKTDAQRQFSKSVEWNPPATTPEKRKGAID